MLSDSDQKKMTAAILRGQESAGSLKAIIEPSLSAHVDIMLHSFSTCLSLLQSSSHQSNKKRKRNSFREEVFTRKSPTMNINDDGFSWRKYGEKFIKNSPHPRSYYRCSGRNCEVKKHLHQFQDSPPLFKSTYSQDPDLHKCQAQGFLHSAQDNGSFAMIKFDQTSNEHQEMNQNTDQDLLNDNFWVSYELEKMLPHNDFYLDPFQF